MLNFWEQKRTDANARRKVPAQRLAVMVFAVFMTSACATKTNLASLNAPPSNRSEPAAMNSSYGQALRVIVKFRREVAYRDAAFLQDMARQIQGRIAYISSVSLDTHVYQVEPRLGQSQADLLRSLSSIPDVLRVETDAVLKPS